MGRSARAICDDIIDHFPSVRWSDQYGIIHCAVQSWSCRRDPGMTPYLIIPYSIILSECLDQGLLVPWNRIIVNHQLYGSFTTDI